MLKWMKRAACATAVSLGLQAGVSSAYAEPTLLFQGQKPVRWRQSAIWIVGTPDLRVWHAALEEACRWWNAQAGREVLHFIVAPMDDITPIENVVPTYWYDLSADELAQLDEAAAAVELGRSLTALSVNIATGYIARAGLFLSRQTAASGNLALMQRVARHELGHVLGFAHDDALPKSVMFPVATTDPYTLTVVDQRMLRLMYGSRR